MKKLTNAEVVTILRKARRLLNKGWTQKSLARDKWGHDVNDVMSKSACKFCLTGAVLRATPLNNRDGNFTYNSTYHQIITMMNRTLSFSRIAADNPLFTVIYFNDKQPRSARGKQNVIRFVDGLIKTLSR